MPTTSDLKNPDTLPVYGKQGAPDWGADQAALAADLFSSPHQGLLRTADDKVVVYRNEDLQKFARLPQVSHIVHGEEKAPAGVDQETLRWFSHLIANNPFDQRAPEHLPKRKLGMRRVTRKSMGRYSEVAAALVDELIDEASQRDEINFLQDFTQPLLVRFWSHVLGLTLEEVAEASALLDVFFAFFLLAPTEEQLTEAFRAGAAYVRLMVDGLDRASAEGDHPVLAELLEDYNEMGEVGRPTGPSAFFAAFAVDAFHTLASQLANVTQALVAAPDAHARVKDDGSLVSAAFFEGSRLHPGIVFTLRQTVADLDYAGVAIPAETEVMMLWSPGNRDPEFFVDPDEYRLERENRDRQQTFGGGIYVCPGRNLGELMSMVVLAGLTKPGVEIKLAADTTWTGQTVEHCPIRMPVTIRRSGA